MTKNYYNNTLPYSFKYYENNPIFGSRWFIYGHYDNNNVSISDGHGDIFINIPYKFAIQLIKIRDIYVDGIENINIKLSGNRRMFTNK